MRILSTFFIALGAAFLSSLAVAQDAALLSVISRKTHGALGPFDTPIATGIPIGGALSVESRTSGAGHTLIFTFDRAITQAGTVTVTNAAAMSVGNGASAQPMGNTVVVTLPQLPANVRERVSLSGVNGNVNAEATLAFLAGDINGSRVVDAADLAAAKSMSGRAPTQGMHHSDIGITGVVTAADIAAIKARMGAIAAISPVTLSLTFAGTGSGTVSSSPAGMACSAACSGVFETGTSVMLTASPASGSVFGGWSGACSGMNAAATVTLNMAASCTATFQPAGPIPNPILFVAQIPTPTDFLGRLSTFGNHLTGATQVVRGGDLMIRYPDGTVRNLTQEAGFGVTGAQVDTNPPSTGNNRPIAVREPSVHWSGTKAIFSMVVGAPRQYQYPTYRWQMYEITGLGIGQTAVITKVANQPADYNNVSPLYGTDERILFTSDRPRDGQAHLYPQLDEYESSQTISGIWSIDPAISGGDLRLLNHTPSGAFSPSIDSFGRVVFTRWDHLQQDQQADVDRANPMNPTYGSYNFANEAANSAFNLTDRTETYPEPRANSTSGLFGGYPVNGYTSNLFTPWQINEDGTDEETLNHIGRQELSFGFLQRSFANDTNLSDTTNAAFRANTHEIRQDTGLFHVREDPTQAGRYYAIAAREFGSLTANQIVTLNGAPNVSPESMAVTSITPRDGTAGMGQPTSPGGRFRNPLPLTSGKVVAAHTTAVEPDIATYTPFRLKMLRPNATTGLMEADPAPITGSGLTKTVSWFTPDTMDSYSGLLWEIEPVEVVARTKPPKATSPIPSVEATVFTEVGVDPAAFTTWMKQNNLALIVTRNQTLRDRADLQQPFNLRVPGGVSSIKPGSATLPGGATAYDISHYQIFQADLIRAYTTGGGGRRAIPRVLNDATAVAKNAAYAPNATGPAGSVKIATDGSTAAFVPARRALAWQTTDNAGNAVVRERVWVTMQPGEVRVCASCHGVNNKSQINTDGPTNKPEALRSLLQAWKNAGANP
jgi:hypothetical protein